MQAQIHGRFAEHRPAEGFDDSRHRVEGVEQLQIIRNRCGGISHWREEKPELGHHGEDISDIPIEDVERRKPQPHAERDEEGEDDEKGNCEHCPRKRDFIIKHHPDHDEEGDAEIDHAAEYG